MKNRLLCHMTHINNLTSILKNDGLLCKNELLRTGSSFKDIANLDVQDKRAKVTVPLEPYGTLHDYVPFYFWGTTPMLLKNQPQQNDIIFLALKSDMILESGIAFVFTDRHAIIQYAKFYNNLDDLYKLDWEIIKNKYWFNTDEQPDRREKKQAEFLIYKTLPFKHIYGIGVANDNTMQNVESILKDSPYKPIIKIKEEWYFT